MKEINLRGVVLRLLVCAPLMAAWAASAHAAGPTQVTIEPDDFAENTVLDHVSPFVTLSTGAFDDNRPTFSVTAVTDAPGASTGSKVFAHVGIPFWNAGRTFRMDFHAPVTGISVDYVSSGFPGVDLFGRLEAYSSTGALVAMADTPLLPEGESATMTVAAPSIAYALAYPPSDPFGNLDSLRFTVVPEPQTLSMLAVAATFAAAVRPRWAARRAAPTLHRRRPA